MADVVLPATMVLPTLAVPRAIAARMCSTIDSISGGRFGPEGGLVATLAITAALLAEGAAHVWYEAARRGPTSYTCFYARRGTLRIDAGNIDVRRLHAEEQVADRAAHDVASARKIRQTREPAEQLVR